MAFTGLFWGSCCQPVSRPGRRRPGLPPAAGRLTPRGSRHRPAVGGTKASEGRATWRRAGDGREGLGQSRARPRGEIPRLQPRVSALSAKPGGSVGLGMQWWDAGWCPQRGAGAWCLQLAPHLPVLPKSFPAPLFLTVSLQDALSVLTEQQGELAAFLGFVGTCDGLQ